MNDAIKLQSDIRARLENKGIYPYSVIYTSEGLGGNNRGGLLSITLYNIEDYNKLLEISGYKSICDRSGFLLLEDTLTIIISGMSLLSFSSTL